MLLLLRFAGSAPPVRLGLGFSLLRPLASRGGVRFGALAGSAFDVSLRSRGVRLGPGLLCFRISFGLHMRRRGSLGLRISELFLHMAPLGDDASILGGLGRFARVLDYQARIALQSL